MGGESHRGVDKRLILLASSRRAIPVQAMFQLVVALLAFGCDAEAQK
jgi:hypothetical protein